MSLLTQFYPGPGGGGSDTTMASAGGSSYMIALFPSGVASAPASVAGAAGNSGIWIPCVPPASGSLSGLFFNVQWAAPNGPNQVLMNNLFTGQMALGPNLERVILSGTSVYGGSFTFSNANFKSIEGTGRLIGQFSTQNCSNFTSISTGIEFYPGDLTPSFVALAGNALDAASVNHVLESIARNNIGVNVGGPKNLDISGGTNAQVGTLSVAAIAARDALVLDGWTVTLRP